MEYKEFEEVFREGLGKGELGYLHAYACGSYSNSEVESGIILPVDLIEEHKKYGRYDMSAMELDGKHSDVPATVTAERLDGIKRGVNGYILSYNGKSIEVYENELGTGYFIDLIDDLTKEIMYLYEDEEEYEDEEDRDKWTETYNRLEGILMEDFSRYISYVDIYLNTMEIEGMEIPESIKNFVKRSSEEEIAKRIYVAEVKAGIRK